MAMYGRQSQWQLIWGVALILIGVFLLFDRFFIFSFPDMVRILWPVSLIAIGVSRLFGRPSVHRIDPGRENAQSPSI